VDVPEPDTTPVTAAAAARTCIVCDVRFDSLDEQRAHFKLDWHRLNLKRKVAGLPPLAEDECERLLDDNASSLSGSGGRLYF
jgi:pre-60S factor REI1